MDEELLRALLDRVKPVAVAAGKAILSIPPGAADVTDKADGTPLTRADLASHETILAGLRELEGAFPIVSEEGDLEGLDDASYETFWLVDPLDGTKEFVKGLGEYTVNIALIDRGRPVLGVVYVPAADELYYAASGLGAFKARGAARPARIAPSDRAAPRTAVVSRSHRSAQTEQFLKELNVTDTIERGSSLKMCAVAEGAADIYPRFGPTFLWDTAAGTAVAREAGCAVAGPDGRDLSYDLAGGIRHAGFLVCPERLRGLSRLRASH